MTERIYWGTTRIRKKGERKDWVHRHYIIAESKEEAERLLAKATETNRREAVNFVMAVDDGEDLDDETRAIFMGNTRS